MAGSRRLAAGAARFSCQPIWPPTRRISQRAAEQRRHHLPGPATAGPRLDCTARCQSADLGPGPLSRARAGAGPGILCDAGHLPTPSLRNILKEVARDPALAGRPAARPTEIASLQRWASQGVLLLNTCLSVEAGAPGSHAKQGWEQLTDRIVCLLANRPQPVVFMLWGAQAQAKKRLVDLSPAAASHLLLMANHPSPLSALRGPRPFIGCGHFGKANYFLQQNRQATIDWQ